MAYNRDEIFEKAKAAIKEYNLIFIEDIVAYLPCGKTAFYDLIPTESNESNALKEMLEQNKIRTKVDIRSKLSHSERASELLALYRLVCTPDERKMLNQNYVEMTGKDGKDLVPSGSRALIDRISEMTDEEIDARLKKLEEQRR